MCDYNYISYGIKTNDNKYIDKFDNIVNNFEDAFDDIVNQE